MEYKIPEVNWGVPLDNVLGAAESGDKIVVPNKEIRSFAKSAAVRVGKSDVEIVVEGEEDA
jgi:hypothetical protein